MLSRVADNLYWMNRYVERAESLARMVEVNQDNLLELDDNIELDRFWLSSIHAFHAHEYIDHEKEKSAECFFLFSDSFFHDLLTCGPTPPNIVFLKGYVFFENIFLPVVSLLMWKS